MVENRFPVFFFLLIQSDCLYELSYFIFSMLFHIFDLFFHLDLIPTLTQSTVDISFIKPKVVDKCVYKSIDLEELLFSSDWFMSQRQQLFFLEVLQLLEERKILNTGEEDLLGICQLHPGGKKPGTEGLVRFLVQSIFHTYLRYEYNAIL